LERGGPSFLTLVGEMPNAQFQAADCHKMLETSDTRRACGLSCEASQHGADRLGIVDAEVEPALALMERAS